jgi:hypothetical protein
VKVKVNILYSVNSITCGRIHYQKTTHQLSYNLIKPAVPAAVRRCALRCRFTAIKTPGGLGFAFASPKLPGFFTAV